MGAFADEIAPCRRQLQHPQRVSGRGSIEDDVVIAFLDGFIGDEAGKLIERRNFNGAGAGELFLHVGDHGVRQNTAIG